MINRNNCALVMTGSKDYTLVNSPTVQSSTILSNNLLHFKGEMWMKLFEVTNMQ